KSCSGCDDASYEISAIAPRICFLPPSQTRVPPVKGSAIAPLLLPPAVPKVASFFRPRRLPSAVPEGFLPPSQKRLHPAFLPSLSIHRTPVSPVTSIRCGKLSTIVVPSFLSEAVAYLSSHAKIHPPALTRLFVAYFFTLFNPLALWFKRRSLPFYVDIVQIFRPFVDVDALVREILCEENALFLAIDEVIADEIFESNEEHSVPRPMHTSSHIGHIWINVVLQGHEQRCYNMFRLHPTTFMRLRDELMERDLIRDSRYVKAMEKLTIFMYAMGHGVASGAMCKHFQHSSETISKHVREVTKALASLRFNYIKLPRLTDSMHPRIRDDDRFYPYFKDAIGAIDGTHVPAHILREKHARYRNRKGVISQNVIGVCGFDLVFQYVGVGFEGVDADMAVFRRALDTYRDRYK
ncbi:hypothetical protein Taro_044588, partial [Colocasia esculenta]|nr:hypothetical protein [Colocasia esculenta]